MKDASYLIDIARTKCILVATAESCTGGMLASEITEMPGSSDIFDCGFVTYSNAAKEAMLGVRAATLARFGAVSEEVAREMATGAQARSRADMAVSITGIAGPGASGHKPEGRVCFALAHKADLLSETVEFGAIGRNHVRKAATGHALSLLIRALA